MSIYDVNYNLQAVELLPPDKRFRSNVTFMQVLFSPIKWCRDMILASYRDGTTAPNYAPGFYNKGEQVVYKKAVYESLVDNNTDLPIETDTWIKVQDNFLGAVKRAKFNGQKIILEYALNQRFGSQFRQPPLISDIYIVNNPAVVDGFIVGQTEPYCSSVGQTLSSDSIGNTYPFVQIINFTIHVPAATFAMTNEQEIRDFLLNLIPASLNYVIQIY